MTDALESKSVGEVENVNLSITSDGKITDQLKGMGIDALVEYGTRILYQRLSRRAFLSFLGKLILAAVGAEITALLPIDRQVDKVEAAGHDCTSWRYCNIYAPKLCYCCVNNHCMCPYNTLPDGYWTGCCRNPSDGRYYVIKYWDCCKTGTPQCINPNCKCLKVLHGAYCANGHPYYCTAACVSTTC